MAEIHKSKNTYNSYTDLDHADYDIILAHVDKINIRTIAEAKRNKAKRLSTAEYERRKMAGEKVKQADCEVKYTTITKEELIFRVMTFDHVPQEPVLKIKPKTTADHHAKCNFPPFKHYANVDGTLKEVMRSHWEGGFDNGKFNTQHGSISNNLAKMYIKLCERYSMRSNWRGYTYVDEMRSHALLQLSQIGLQFNELKSQNPFAYYTAAVTNSFTRVLNLEKRNQNIRDDLLQENGQMPSWTRQIEHEMAERAKWDQAADKERKEHGYNI